jgi:NitT/TauT family transport system ATP-binding protein
MLQVAQRKESIPTVIDTLRSADPASLDFRSVNKTFSRGSERFNVLRDVSLSIEAGTFVCIVGPSGCGKTTLLRIAMRIVTADSGDVLVDASERYGTGKDVAMVFQNYGLFPWQTVERNVSFGLRVQRAKDAVRRAQLYLARVGLERFGSFYPHQLSGGMQQRVGLARALACGPRVLLMDEPFAAVDAMTREELQGLVLEVWREQRMTALFVTHDIGEAVYLADRVIVMGAGPGRIVADIPIPLPRPRGSETRLTEEFGALERNIRKALACA